MDAEQFLKEVSPNDNYGLREKLNKNLLRRQVTGLMEAYYKKKLQTDLVDLLIELELNSVLIERIDIAKTVKNFINKL